MRIITSSQPDRQVFVPTLLLLALLLALLPALLPAGPVAAQQPQPSGAKRLFYDPATGQMLTDKDKRQKTPQGRVKVRATQQPTQAKYPGLHYWIELEGVGPVTDDRVFITGERIRLHVRSNVDGYLSLWSLDSSNRGQLLFPSPAESGGDNLVKADSEYVSPGYIKFAPPAEEERLMVLFSRNRDELPKPQNTSLDSKLIAKGSKALVFETEKNAAAEIGTYVVNRQGGPIAKVIRLQHRKPQDTQ